MRFKSVRLFFLVHFKSVAYTDTDKTAGTDYFENNSRDNSGLACKSGAIWVAQKGFNFSVFVWIERLYYTINKLSQAVISERENLPL